MSSGHRSTPHVRRRPVRRVVAAVAALGLVLTVAAPSAPATAATPAEQKRAEAKRIAAQREKLTVDAERLNEQAKQTEDQLTELGHRITETTRQLAAQRTAADAISTEAARLALNAYVHGDVADGIGAALTEDGATNLQLHRGYTPVALGGSSDVLDQARAVQQDTEALVAQLDAQQRQQERLKATLAERQAGVAATQTKLAALARQVDADLERLVAEEQEAARAAAEAAAAAKAREKAAELARQAEAERARAAAAAAAAATTAAPRPVANGAARTTAANPAAGNPGAARPGATATTPATTAPRRTARTTAPPADDPGPPAPAPVIDVPPTSPAAAIAVAEALAQLGKRYVFGTNGPDTFDCSGLTQWAWAKAGVSMPHYTVSQFQAFPQVPLDQLQPGDLVFFNVNLGHMGMYIGNGQYVHAPRTGDVVKISPLAGRNVVGAVRPG